MTDQPLNNRLEKENATAWKYINTLQRELYNTKEKLAPLLGFKPFKAKYSEQVIWAKSQEDAEKILIGDSIFKYVDEAINE